MFNVSISVRPLFGEITFEYVLWRIRRAFRPSHVLRIFLPNNHVSLKTTCLLKLVHADNWFKHFKLINPNSVQLSRAFHGRITRLSLAGDGDEHFPVFFFLWAPTVCHFRSHCLLRIVLIRFSTDKRRLSFLVVYLYMWVSVGRFSWYHFKHQDDCTTSRDIFARVLCRDASRRIPQQHVSAYSPMRVARVMIISYVSGWQWRRGLDVDIIFFNSTGCYDIPRIVIWRLTRSFFFLVTTLLMLERFWQQFSLTDLTCPWIPALQSAMCSLLVELLHGNDV